MACPCVSQAVCHSATTASVVWPLALFSSLLDVYPLAPGILILDVVQTEKPLRLIAHSLIEDTGPQGSSFSAPTIAALGKLR